MKVLFTLVSLCTAGILLKGRSSSTTQNIPEGHQHYRCGPNGKSRVLKKRSSYAREVKK